MPMRALLIALFLGIVSPTSEPRGATHVESLVYPPTARLAHAVGDAQVLIRIDSVGRVESVTDVSGHPWFLRAAAQNVKTWRFKSGPPEEMNITYHFKLEASQTEDPATVCSFDLPDSVTILSHLYTPPIY